MSHSLLVTLVLSTVCPSVSAVRTRLEMLTRHLVTLKPILPHERLQGIVCARSVTGAIQFPTVLSAMYALCLQDVKKAERAAKEEEQRQADLRSYKNVMTVSAITTA